ncbi:signal recognition particle-docking protein FtsY [Thermoanaerobacterium thermosaccharolyticum]|uniref:signal recognition particle-docking protein FtsY n=1 Tax=Thermoanaerobacterium thermosaccharolyticum TaxID=1517 RepID=UPI003DAA326E
MLNFFKKNKKEDANLEKDKKGLYQKLKDGLTRTRSNFTAKIDGILSLGRKIDDELFEELEEILILADVGVVTTEKIIENMKIKAKEQKIKEADKIKDLLAEEIYNIMEANERPFNITSPTLILIVGVNGVGKTTTIGKLANKYKNEGKKVLLVAADTFRAAAIDQLEVWAGRNNCEIIKHEEGSDPASVVFDGIKAAKARGADIILCDTAGRLHNKKNLMEELKKIYRVAQREFDNSNIETLLVLDATTGQNAVQQAKIFKEAVNVTGIILTKLDGTAKGGIVVSIKSELDIPVRFIGVGEGIDDLQEFDSEKFVRALFE